MFLTNFFNPPAHLLASRQQISLSITTPPNARRFIVNPSRFLLVGHQQGWFSSIIVSGISTRVLAFVGSPTTKHWGAILSVFPPTFFNPPTHLLAFRQQISLSITTPPDARRDYYKPQ
ncbi:MAG TPA: hypothetical protein VIU12_01510 [Chryseolinea sp.]